MLENMLDYIRIGLYTVLLVLAFFLLQDWNKEHASTPTPQTVSQAENTIASRYVPEAPTTTAPGAVKTSTVAPASSAATGQLIKVRTDVLDVTIDTRGGDIISSKLLKYPESLHATQPFVLLNNDGQTQYVAESGLLSKQGPDTSQAQALYTSPQTSYQLTPGQNTLTVTLNWQNADGLKVNKVFTFTKDSYQIKVGYDIQNDSNQAWQGNLYTQLLRTNVPPPQTKSGFINLSTYFGAAISTPDKRFEKITFKSMQQNNLNVTAKDGWAAMIQHYFISAWVPPQDATSNYYSKVTPNGLYTIGMINQPLTVAPGAKASTVAKLYTGPAIADKMEQTAPSLNLTIDYGWFWFISSLIFWMMQKIYDVVGNWGWSIVLVTIIIKLLFYQLSAKSYRSMSALKRLQPRIELLKERYGDDKQQLTKATLELYREEKVNPMSGCLPILIQIPVFIALYWVLVESVELRQAPFILWIHDLSQADPYYILPLLMGVSMFIQQRLNPPPADPMQAKIMMLMPVIFTVMFASFPAGLMLYWFVNNTLSVLQQWYIMQRVDNEVNARKSK